MVAHRTKRVHPKAYLLSNMNSYKVKGVEWPGETPAPRKQGGPGPGGPEEGGLSRALALLWKGFTHSAITCTYQVGRAIYLCYFVSKGGEGGGAGAGGKEEEGHREDCHGEHFTG